MDKIIGSNREKVVELQKQFPHYKPREIGTILGITKERVRQILIETGNYNRCKKQYKHKCNQCGKLTNNKCFCSIKCSKEFHQGEFICDQCGKIFSRAIYRVMANVRNGNAEHSFCSNECKALWMVAHRSSQRGTVRSRKYDYDMVWKKHLETGFGCSRLGKLLNIDAGAVNNILKRKRLDNLNQH